MDFYKCVANAVEFQKIIEWGSIFEFRAGLNSEYDQVRIQILGKESLLFGKCLLIFIMRIVGEVLLCSILLVTTSQ